MSLDFASRVNGPRAPDRAILALLSSCVARFVIQPTALHCTSTLGDIICRIRGVSPPSWTIRTLFSAERHISDTLEWIFVCELLTVHGKISQRGTSSSLNLDVGVLKKEENGLKSIAVNSSYICDIESARLPNVNCPSYYAPRSVISAKVRLALRWRSILSEKTSVLRARRGSPEKKSVSPRCKSVSGALVSACISIDAHSRDIEGGRPQPPARCRRGHYHRGHRGISLKLTSAQT